MKGYTSRRFAGIPLGMTIRRSIGKTWTFRLRKGNGQAGTRIGELVQDKYPYTVPDPNADHVGVGNKTNFAQAISNWQNVLTPAEKAEYNRRAAIKKKMSGYNLYIREYRLGLT
jgi:hypothetical protein